MLPLIFYITYVPIFSLFMCWCLYLWVYISFLDEFPCHVWFQSLYTLTWVFLPWSPVALFLRLLDHQLFDSICVSLVIILITVLSDIVITIHIIHIIRIIGRFIIFWGDGYPIFVHLFFLLVYPWIGWFLIA